MSAWDDILIALGGNAAILIVLGFLARSLIQTWLTKDIRRFEADLKSTADQNLERLRQELKSEGDASVELLKNQLQQTANEHQVRFSKLHERRADVIEKLYVYLVDAGTEGRLFITGDAHLTDERARREAYLEIGAKMKEVSLFINKSRIYLPESIVSLLQGLSLAMRQHVSNAAFYAPLDPQGAASAVDRNEALTNAYRAYFLDDIPLAMRALEDEFRRLLGVDTSRPSDSAK
jgi:hypothetical protein